MTDKKTFGSFIKSKRIEKIFSNKFGRNAVCYQFSRVRKVKNV